MIGRTLSHYEITAKLGEGGMGEVWQATDRKLGREIALKVLPEDLAADPDRLARFEREARSVAALNHPNIVTIHSVEEADGVHLLTMEKVAGKSLDQLLPPGGFDLEKLFSLGSQIADAVAAAHEQGIVHRDLKPANVMVTDGGPSGIPTAGRVKILDFGLAKLAAQEVSGEEATITAGVSDTLTQPGMVLGTVPYMSPEQVQGQPADHRSDIFSLGILLFEMATGQRPFRGDNAASVMSAILRDQPPTVTELQPYLPNHLGRIVRRCLEKHPERRYQSARDVQLELEGLERELSVTSSGSMASTSTTGMLERAKRGAREPSTSSSWKALAIALGLTTLALGARWLIDGRSQPSGGSLEVAAMDLLTDLPGSQSDPSLSPDGTQLLYVAEDGGDLDIFLLRVGGQNAINLTADFDGRDHHPAWSPDGQRIAFSSDRDGGGVFVMEATGESPLRVSDEGFHPSWSPDGERLMVTSEDIFDPVSRISTAGMTIVDLTLHQKHLVSVSGDAVEGQWSPDGNLIAYWATEGGQRDIRVIASTGIGPYVEITNDPATDWGPVWAPNGSILYFLSDRGGSPDLWRVPIDPATGAVDGPFERVTAGVARVVAASLARDGRRIAIATERISASIERFSFDSENERPLSAPETVLFSSNDLHQMALSRDERWLAYRSKAPKEDLFVLRVDGSGRGRRQLTDDGARDRGPSWGPEDEWLLFYSNRGGLYEHWMIRPDGTGLRRTATHPAGLVQPHWSGDGRWIASGFGIRGARGQSLSGGVYEVEEVWLDPSATFEPATAEPQFAMTPTGWSPDDRYISGWGLNGDVVQHSVYEVGTQKMTFLAREDGRPFRIGATAATWLDRTRLLFWDDEDAMTYVADVETGASRTVADIPGPAEFSVADGGRLLYSLRSVRESDIWLLTLDDPEDP